MQAPPETKTAPKPLSQLACTKLRGVGPQLNTHLQKLGIHTIQDLLFHLPLRYQDKTRITPLAKVRRGEHAVIEGAITETQLRQGRRQSLLCQLEDETGSIALRFFHFNQAQRDILTRKGLRLRCYGEVRWGMTGFEMVHPEYRIVHPDMPQPIEEHLTPIYPTTEGLQQNSFRKLTDQALTFLTESASLEDHLPVPVREQFALQDLTAAIHFVHRPPPDASQIALENGQHPAQQRLAFEELLAHQLSLRRVRLNLQSHLAMSLSSTIPLTPIFLSQLNFSLTHAQQRVIKEISTDLEQTRPMLRLVQGDVGAGKTVVAAIAVLQAVANGFQAAVMAPTELLAEQHFKTFSTWLEPLGIKVDFLAGKLKESERQLVLQKMQKGITQVVVGTHALFQKDVQFHNLALVVIDEQHRFGVHQRLELWEKGRQENHYPHQLIMTATPIPRTLAMTAYADLDCSIIDELPPGRKPIKTILISNTRREEVAARVLHICQNGQQAYWVCTLIEESELLQSQAAEATAEFLAEHLPNLRIGLIHGRLKPAEKEAIMQAFHSGEIQLLVATTVIEVGVDVPNATLMIIENAERLGLAQLHQLRGRIGRGTLESHCVLLYQEPLSLQARQRLKVLRNSQNGFEIAQKDLELRGPGEVLGTRQTGIAQLKIADLLRDKALLPQVQQASDLLLKTYPENVEPLIARWVLAGGKYGSVF